MKPGVFTVLDLAWSDSELVANVYRYFSTTYDPLCVRWAVTERPDGFEPVVDGAAYVLAENMDDEVNLRVHITKAGQDFIWSEPPSQRGLMLVLVLPEGYVLPKVRSATPTIGEAKMFQERMVLYWSIPWKETYKYGGEAEFKWRLKRVQYTSQRLQALCSSLNEQAVQRRQKTREQLAEPVILLGAQPVLSIAHRKQKPMVTITLTLLGSIIAAGIGILMSYAPHTPPAVLVPVLQYWWLALGIVVVCGAAVALLQSLNS